MNGNETVEADTVLGKFKLSSGSLNTLLTTLLLVVCCLIYYSVWIHTVDARSENIQVAQDLKQTNKELAVALREANTDQTNAMKEMTKAIREQTCLISMPEGKRTDNVDLCRRLSR